MKNLFLMLLVIFSISSQAQESARQLQTSYEDLDFSKVKVFGKRELNDYFKFVRDVRFLQDPEFPDQQRRLTWLLPDGGCQVRAALVSSLIKSFGRKGFVEHIFIFGKLKVKTKYSRMGEVHWGFHVAPIVKVKNELFVIDPALNIERPLPLKKWISLQTGIENARFTICHGSAIGPDDNCKDGEMATDVEAKALYSMEFLLKMERMNLRILGFDQDKLLGPNPPWMTN